MAQHPLHDLLLACLRTAPTPMLSADLAQLLPSDWQQLLKLSEQQQIAPLLYHRLKEHQLLELVAPAVRQQLQQLQLTNSVRNLRIYHELRLLATALQTAHIPCIVLKGAHLAMAVYPNPALRYMADLDLLVQQADLPAAVALLREQGYVPLTPIVVEAQLHVGRHLPPFKHPERVACVEIHWTITLPNRTYTTEMAGFWAQAQPVTLVTLSTRGLCVEDLLLHICIHATYQHYFAQDVRFLCDLDAIVRRYPALNWQTITTRAQQHQWAKGVHIALQLAKQLLGTPIPAASLAALWPTPLPITIVESALAEIFADKTVDQPLSANFVEVWQSSQKLELAQSKDLFRRIFVRPTILAGIYSISPRSPKLIFYYLVRLLDLVSCYGGKVWQLWRGTSPLVRQVARSHQLIQWLDPTLDQPKSVER